MGGGAPALRAAAIPGPGSADIIKVLGECEQATVGT
jgi:hypothetical protein